MDDQSKFLVVEVVGRLCNLSEVRRKCLLKRFLLSGSYEVFADRYLSQTEDARSNPPQVASQVAKSEVLHFGGYPLLKKTQTETKTKRPSNFVQLPSLEPAFKTVSRALFEAKPVLIQGPMGCGKTRIVEHLASLTNREEFVTFHRIQMSDQTDARSLIGGYSCRDVPGQFRWEDGVLTTAVKHGHWLLIEDADLAPSDVLATLIPLIELRQLHVSSRGVILNAAAEFQLFLTRRTGSTNTRAFDLTKSSTVVDVQHLADAELSHLLRSLYPKCNDAIEKMVQCYQAVREGSLGRTFSLRDLLKWAKRLTVTGLSPENVVLEGMDCFCNHLPLNQNSNHILGLGRTFNLLTDTIHHLMRERSPCVSTTDRQIKVGRSSLLRLANSDPPQRRYFLTKQASKLLEFLATSVNNAEPVLLVGETGVGKTSAIQFLADSVGKKLQSVNLNQQTESSDLLGGFKPVDFEHFVIPVRQEFEALFQATFSPKDNVKFLSHLSRCFAAKRWEDLIQLMVHASRGALKKVGQENGSKWRRMQDTLSQLQTSLEQKSKMLFSFVNGVLTNAAIHGDWILLDEVNMADADVLECLADIMNVSVQKLCLYGGGDVIQKHPDFRVFACMNPATDVGKKDLPDGLRNRFSEYYIDEPQNEHELVLIVQNYLGNLVTEKNFLNQIVKFYMAVKKLADAKLTDGAGRKPTYSLRTLCRALIISSKNQCQHPRKSVLEAFLLCFLTELDRSSYPLVLALVLKYLGGSKASQMLHASIPKPPQGGHINIEGYWLRCGSNDPHVQPDYILTETVRQNLKDIARIVSFSQLAVLIQGETSVGKTSMISYLAAATGNTCVRINNHEHTDIQEYVGAYAIDESGNFTFQEGVLARAMRNGHWIILDELNLAPSDVLEALNRVLDDNRELFIPETQTVVQAHENFRIFATQNPSGSYGGRKTLSRAFRNRFIELHFGDLPSDEVSVIIEKRCRISRVASKKLVKIMQELQLARKGSAALEGKRGYLTLRDLFRWALRCSTIEQTTTFYDWEQHFAEEGYLVLANKVRRDGEADTIRRVIEKVFKRKIDPNAFYDLSPDAQGQACVTAQEVKVIKDMADDPEIVWTKAAVRLAVLVLHSLRFNEPVLLVGETGCGKTRITQTLAKILQRNLIIINCHLNTETSDFLGGLRPSRDHESDALFEWVDGPLVNALKSGDFLLVDEISLAEDSVLERMNSVLEPSRSLVLVERASDNHRDVIEITAHPAFQFIATMNPGNDYGKKELSPALRNRLVEIWCPSLTDPQDIRLLIEQKLLSPHPQVSQTILDFAAWYRGTPIGKKVPLTTRDLVGWLSFVNATRELLGPECSLVHGICLVIFDGLGTFLTKKALEDTKETARQFFAQHLPDHRDCDCLQWITSHGVTPEVVDDQAKLKVASFEVRKKEGKTVTGSFNFRTETVTRNLLKVLRGMCTDKPILLEGTPGVGKSSLVTALANVTGNKLVRINLSDQTEISDLFGSDLPLSDGDNVASFAWQDGPFLAALKAGHWILLDELNLATQSVLEGLNACLDHRGEVFIPELNRTFVISASQTRIFGAQNPPREGGDRKNLPKSFLNRFAKVYLGDYSMDDQIRICQHEFPRLPERDLRRLLRLINELQSQIGQDKRWGHLGKPWSFNLRDALRWCQAVAIHPTLQWHFANLLFVRRFRTESDQQRAQQLVDDVFQDCDTRQPKSIKDGLKIGRATIKKVARILPKLDPNFVLLKDQIGTLENVTFCVQQSWMPILVGPGGTGKTTMVRIVAALHEQELEIVSLNSASDTSELLGGFEQVGQYERFSNVCNKVSAVLHRDQDRLTSHQTWLDFEKVSQENSAPKLKAFLESCPQSEQLRDCIEELDRLSAKTGFDWMESLLIKAMRKGSWLLFDNANYCNPSVLDRLNGLLETNGVLEVGEQGCAGGVVPKVVPHPDFRLFLTMNPLQGELSPAMRNRGVEIYVSSKPGVGHLKIQDVSRYPKASLMRCQLSLMKNYPNRMIAIKTFLNALTEDHEPTLRLEMATRDLGVAPDFAEILRRKRGQAPMLSEIEATKYAVFSALENDFDLPVEVKQLWSVVTRLFVAFTDALSTEQVTPETWMRAKFVLRFFHQLREHLGDKDVFKIWSVLWLQIKDPLESMAIGGVNEVNDVLLPFFQAFNLTLRRFVEALGFSVNEQRSEDQIRETKQALMESCRTSLLRSDDLTWTLRCVGISAEDQAITHQVIYQLQSEAVGAVCALKSGSQSKLFPLDFQRLLALPERDLKDKVMLAFNALKQDYIQLKVCRQLREYQGLSDNVAESKVTLTTLMRLVMNGKTEFGDVAILARQDRVKQLHSIRRSIKNVDQNLTGGGSAVESFNRVLFALSTLLVDETLTVPPMETLTEVNAFLRAHSAVLEHVQKSCPEEIRSLIQRSLAEVSNMEDEDALKVVTGLLQFQIASCIGKVDSAQHYQILLNSTTESIENLRSEMIAFDSCDTLFEEQEPLEKHHASQVNFQIKAYSFLLYSCSIVT